jgi:hypothetical protein
MQSRKTQNNVMATINELAELIRKDAPIEFGLVCAKKHIAPSTLYNYIRVLLPLCKDIKYINGVFEVNGKTN